MPAAEIAREQVGSHICFAAQPHAKDGRSQQSCPCAAGKSKNECSRGCQGENKGLNAFRRDAIDCEADAEPANDTRPSANRQSESCTGSKHAVLGQNGGKIRHQSVLAECGEDSNKSKDPKCSSPQRSRNCHACVCAVFSANDRRLGAI